MKQFWEENKKNLWFWLFIVVALSTAVALPLMSLDAGNSGDEDGFQVIQGRNVINYFESDGADTTCFSFSNLKYYGSSPDVITEFPSAATRRRSSSNIPTSRTRPSPAPPTRTCPT